MLSHGIMTAHCLPLFNPQQRQYYFLFFFKLVWVTGWYGWRVDPADRLIQLGKNGYLAIIKIFSLKDLTEGFQNTHYHNFKRQQKIDNNKSKWSCLSDEWKHVAMLDADILVCEFLTTEPRTNCPGLSKSVLEIPGISSQNEETASEHFCVPLHAQRAVSFQHLDMCAYKWFCQRGHK